MKLKMLTKQIHKVLNQCPSQKCHKDHTSTDTFQLLQEDYESDGIVLLIWKVVIDILLFINRRFL